MCVQKTLFYTSLVVGCHRSDGESRTALVVYNAVDLENYCFDKTGVQYYNTAASSEKQQLKNRVFQVRGSCKKKNIFYVYCIIFGPCAPQSCRQQIGSFETIGQMYAREYIEKKKIMYPFAYFTICSF